MKKILLAAHLATTMLLPFGVQAEELIASKADLVRFCTSISNLAESTARARDRGVPQEKVEAVIENSMDQTPPPIKEFLLKSIATIYNSKSTSPYQTKLIYNLSCIQTFILEK